MPAAASLPRLLAPDVPSPGSARVPFLLAIGGLTLMAWRLRAPGDATTEALLFWAAAVACVITSPAGWVMGLVLALPLAPLAVALIAGGALPRGPTVALVVAWSAVAVPAPFAGWPALAGAALIVVTVVAASTAPSESSAPGTGVIVLGLSLALLALAGNCLARATGSRDESRATRAVRVMLWAFAILVVVEATLGACGRLDARCTLAALAAVALALAAGTHRRATDGRDRGREREPLTTPDVACVCALTAAVLLRAWAGFGKTTFLYDTLSYHLHVPATWIADRRLEIVPAVFGDPSSAYAPSNLELWFAFLMAPLHSDCLAGSGQLPFAALAALAIVAAVREAGGRRTAALAAALVFLLIPEVWQQARTAMTDLGLAAFLLASLPFSARAARQGDDGDLLTAAVALGLAVGTKYVGLPLALPFALVVIFSARSGRRRGRTSVAAAAVVLASGGFWYLRNALATGNPFYPVATLGFPGLTDRAAMRAWIYHLPVGQLGALGEMLGAAGFGFVLAAAVVVVWRRLLLEGALLLAVTTVFWLWIPYQESRFLFAAFGVAAVAIGRAPRLHAARLAARRRARWPGRVFDARTMADRSGRPARRRHLLRLAPTLGRRCGGRSPGWRSPAWPVWRRRRP